MQWSKKGSDASKYLEIGPNFGLKEHYYLKGGGHFIQIGSNTFNSINSAILKEMPATCEIGVSFTLEMCPH